jgi:hypothetical protein
MRLYSDSQAAIKHSILAILTEYKGTTDKGAGVAGSELNQLTGKTWGLKFIGPACVYGISDGLVMWVVRGRRSRST